MRSLTPQLSVERGNRMFPDVGRGKAPTVLFPFVAEHKLNRNRHKCFKRLFKLFINGNFPTFEEVTLYEG
jgi:hypothetical protein